MSAFHETNSHSPHIGDSMRDGTVYAGSLDGREIYTTPKDAKLTYTFDQAAEYAEHLNTRKFLGHDDWRVPTKDELSLLFNSRAVIGGFNTTRQGPREWYWSSSQAELYFYSRVQRFIDGHQNDRNKEFVSSLR